MLNIAAWFGLAVTPDQSDGDSSSTDMFNLRFTLAGRIQYHEFGKHAGMEATRYGDWEYYGRCTDF